MSDRETVMSTPVESDKRDRIGIMSPPAWRWYVGGLDVCGGGVNGTFPMENSESNRGRLDHREWSV